MPTLDELGRLLYDAAKTYKSECGWNVYLTELIRPTCSAAWASETRSLFNDKAALFYFFDGDRGPGLPRASGATSVLSGCALANRLFGSFNVLD